MITRKKVTPIHVTTGIVFASGAIPITIGCGCDRGDSSQRGGTRAA